MSSLELARYLEILIEKRNKLLVEDENVKLINLITSMDGEKKEGINLVFKILFDKSLDKIIEDFKNNPKAAEYNHRSNLEVLKETVDELRDNYWRLNQILIAKNKK